jgi:hypothetical protein
MCSVPQVFPWEYIYLCRLFSAVPGEAERAAGAASRGKALFQRCAARTEEETPVEDVQGSLHPSLDFQEIEEEFERLHREMLASDTSC